MILARLAEMSQLKFREDVRYIKGHPLLVPNEVFDGPATCCNPPTLRTRICRDNINIVRFTHEMEN